MKLIHSTDCYKLFYIYHSCFVIASDAANLIFDYWKESKCGYKQTKEEIPHFIDCLNPDVSTYVFVSHHHKDHFSKSIFLWQKIFKQIHYIISYDTAKFIRHLIHPQSTYTGEYRPNPNNLTIMKVGDEFIDEIMKITAFGSSDTGCSYWIENFVGNNIFHAGDLNLWCFRNDSTSAEIAEAQSKFSSVLDIISEKISGRDIDLLMFPLDSRLYTSMTDGPEQFLGMFNVKNFTPMHSCIDFEDKLEYASRCELLKLSRDSLCIEFPKVHINEIPDL